MCCGEAGSARFLTGGWSPAKNELRGGDPEATWPPAMPAAELVEIGPRRFRSARTWTKVSLESLR